MLPKTFAETRACGKEAFSRLATVKMLCNALFILWLNWVKFGTGVLIDLWIIFCSSSMMSMASSCSDLVSCLLPEAEDVFISSVLSVSIPRNKDKIIHLPWRTTVKIKIYIHQKRRSLSPIATILNCLTEKIAAKPQHVIFFQDFTMKYLYSSLFN